MQVSIVDTSRRFGSSPFVSPACGTLRVRAKVCTGMHVCMDVCIARACAACLMFSREMDADNSLRWSDGFLWLSVRYRLAEVSVMELFMVYVHLHSR